MEGAIYFLFMEPASIDAVSYTHLDVYKRQEADRVGLPEDARVFRARAAAYQEQISAIRKKRETAEQYWHCLLYTSRCV